MLKSKVWEKSMVEVKAEGRSQVASQRYDIVLLTIANDTSWLLGSRPILKWQSGKRRRHHFVGRASFASTVERVVHQYGVFYTCLCGWERCTEVMVVVKLKNI